MLGLDFERWKVEKAKGRKNGERDISGEIAVWGTPEHAGWQWTDQLKQGWKLRRNSRCDDGNRWSRPG